MLFLEILEAARREAGVLDGVEAVAPNLALGTVGGGGCEGTERLAIDGVATVDFFRGLVLDPVVVVCPNLLTGLLRVDVGGRNPEIEALPP